MILVEESKNLKVLGVEKKQAKISQENINKLITMMSKQYGDVVGTPIVETVCNAFDAQKEFGTEKFPIIVSKKNGYIHIKDCGGGIDPEKMENVVLDYGTSTKTAEDIGGYGLGLKSVFAYTDIFFIDSVVNGIKYCYQLIHESFKGVTFLLLSQTPVNEQNGSDIFWKIKVGDEDQFNNAVKTKLKYFRNLIVEDFNFDNHFKIFETENYIYSSLSKNNSLEICLGGVVYPINYSLLSRRGSVPLPGALKFSLNEGLKPPPNRETIEYTTKAIEIINNKIDVVLAELEKRYRDQFKPEYNSLDEIIKDNNLRNYLKLSDNLTLYVGNVEFKSVEFKHKDFETPFAYLTHQTIISLLKKRYTQVEKYYKSNLTTKELRSYEKIKLAKIIDFDYICNISNEDIIYAFYTHRRYDPYFIRLTQVEKEDLILKIKKLIFDYLPLFEDTTVLKTKLKVVKFKNSEESFNCKFDGATSDYSISVKKFKEYCEKKTVIGTTDYTFYRSFPTNVNKLKCVYVKVSNWKYISDFVINKEQFLNSKFYKKQLYFNYLKNIKDININYYVYYPRLKSLFHSNKKNCIFLNMENNILPNAFHIKFKNFADKTFLIHQRIEELKVSLYYEKSKMSIYYFLKKNNFNFKNKNEN